MENYLDCNNNLNNYTCLTDCHYLGMKKKKYDIEGEKEFKKKRMVAGWRERKCSETTITIINFQFINFLENYLDCNNNTTCGCHYLKMKERKENNVESVWGEERV